MTPVLRKSWGGLWADPKKVLGAYDCLGTIIYFDPSEAPFNLGAILVHEIEHFVRDKFSYSEHPVEFLSDIPAALLLDETLASMHAAFAQAELRRSMKGRLSHGQINFFGLADLNLKSSCYSLGSDLGLYSKNGNLVALLNNEKSEGFTLGDPFSDFMSQVVTPYRHQKPTQDHWQGIVRLVNDVYFPDHLLPQARVDETLDRWAEIDASEVSGVGSLQLSSPHLEMSAAAFDPKANRFFKTLSRRNDEVSLGCFLIQAAIRGGKTGYIGEKLGLNPVGDGAKPGGDGVKPSAPVVPCVETGDRL